MFLCWLGRSSTATSSSRRACSLAGPNRGARRCRLCLSFACAVHRQKWCVPLLFLPAKTIKACGPWFRVDTGSPSLNHYFLGPSLLLVEELEAGAQRHGRRAQRAGGRGARREKKRVQRARELLRTVRATPNAPPRYITFMISFSVFHDVLCSFH